jgi:hypothetical protein
VKTSTVKKTLFLNQDNIRKAMHHYNVTTETEAVNKALASAAEEAEIIAAHLETGGKARLEQVYR